MLFPQQYGFRSNHSTELAALNLADELTYWRDGLEGYTGGMHWRSGLEAWTRGMDWRDELEGWTGGDGLEG